MTGVGNCGNTPSPLAVYGEVKVERERAHRLHGATSMESFPVDDVNRLAILGEEYGEVCKEFNEARHYGRGVDLVKLRKELIQTAAMAVAWADALSEAAGRCSWSSCRNRATKVVMFDAILHPPGVETPTCEFHYRSFTHIGYMPPAHNEAEHSGRQPEGGAV